MFEFLKRKFSIETYNVGIVLKSISEVMTSGICKGDIHWVNHNYKDRFFADSFLYNEDEEHYYILCEEFIFWEEKGKITLLTFEKDSCRLVDRRVIIEEPYHLSFPFCSFKGDSIIPEACASGKMIKYSVDENLKVTGKTVNSFENPPYQESMHTFNVYDNCIIVDGSGDFVRFPMKIVYKARTKLCKG